MQQTIDALRRYYVGNKQLSSLFIQFYVVYLYS